VAQHQCPGDARDNGVHTTAVHKCVAQLNYQEAYSSTKHFGPVDQQQCCQKLVVLHQNCNRAVLLIPSAFYRLNEMVT